MRTANPTLTDAVFRNVHGSGHMSIDGTVNKSLLMTLVVLATSWFMWSLFFQGNSLLIPLFWVGLIGGFITAVVTVFKKEWSPVTAPVYAGLEGFVLGGISSFLEAAYPGIVIQAVALTLGVLLALLLIYKSGLIKVTDNFKLGIFAATGAVALIYLVSFIGSFFGWQIPLIHESGPIGIAFSVIVVSIAALNLVLDFDFIERGARNGAPAFMEWYAAFGLMVTLIWLYIEILRLMTKLRSRN